MKRVKPEDIYGKAVEMLVIGGSKCIPVVQIDGRKIGNGLVGPFAKWVLSVLHSPETFGVKLETINDKYK
jgi:hypothetical protein